MHKKADAYATMGPATTAKGTGGSEPEPELALTGVVGEKQLENKMGKKLAQTHKFKEKVKFAQAEQFGSRAVGGHKPRDEVMYGQIQSTDYLIPDTAAEEAYQRTFTPTMRNRRRLFVWVLYLWLGVSVAVFILYTLNACDWILKKRVKATAKLLAKNDTLGAFLMWTGSSLALCLVSCIMVLWQPAAASSGIPALIAYLNGVIPLGGKSPLTGKRTGFRSWQTLFAKLVGMILSIPSGLCLGPEGTTSPVTPEPTHTMDSSRMVAWVHCCNVLLGRVAGPIIHISALLGHHTTRIVQTLSHKILPAHFQFTVKPGEGEWGDAHGEASPLPPPPSSSRRPSVPCLLARSRREFWQGGTSLRLAQHAVSASPSALLWQAAFSWWKKPPVSSPRSTWSTHSLQRSSHTSSPCSWPTPTMVSPSSNRQRGTSARSLTVWTWRYSA